MLGEAPSLLLPQLPGVGFAQRSTGPGAQVGTEEGCACLDKTENEPGFLGARGHKCRGQS